MLKRNSETCSTAVGSNNMCVQYLNNKLIKQYKNVNDDVVIAILCIRHVQTCQRCSF